VLTIRFRPESDRPELIAAAEEYRRLWEEHGSKIVACLERLSELTFAESEIDAIVFDGVSRSQPLKLRASHPPDVKLGTLIHELGHRLLTGRPPLIRFLRTIDAADRSREVHKVLNLLLFDAWTELSGDDFARHQVEVESRWRPLYRDAWVWALAMDRPARQAMLHALLADSPDEQAARG
jgi:hypothetical protein